MRCASQSLHDTVSAIGVHPDGATVAIHVQPRASRTELIGEIEGMLKLRVAAPPVDGAANQAVLVWLAKQLKVPRSSIAILSGERGRKKVLRVAGVTPAQLRTALGLN